MGVFDMETITFKGYEYTVESIPNKAAFDGIYNKLLQKANKGKSIVKDLEKAYRFGSNEVYLIRYDEQRRALVPVRIAKESVDGFLMKNRFGGKDKVLQRGIGSEMSRHTKEVYDAVQKKRNMMEKQSDLSEEKRKKEIEALALDGKNYMIQLKTHYILCREIKSLLERHDVSFQSNRDYKARMEDLFNKINQLYETLGNNMVEVDKDEKLNIDKIRHIFPKDIKVENAPFGFIKLLQAYFFLSLFNNAVQREWITLRDYGLHKGDLPVKASDLLENGLILHKNTEALITAIDKILFPGKIGAKRDPKVQYDITLFTKEVINILSHQ